MDGPIDENTLAYRFKEAGYKQSDQLGRVTMQLAGREGNVWVVDIDLEKFFDGWIRRKLRCYRLKQCGRIYTTYKLLRSLGVWERKSWNVV